MEFHSLQIPPPRGWEDFEALCLDLFRRVWGDPLAQRNGRRGQAQAGTDVWGQPSAGDGRFAGVQCKGKDVGLGAAVTARELRDEVAKALTFSPRLSEWALATTAPKDAAIERLAREISEDHERRGLFRVRVLGWDDLTATLADHRDVVEKHYPDFRGPDSRVLARLDEGALRQAESFELLRRIEGMLVAGAASAAGATVVRDPGPGPPVDVADVTLQAMIDAARDLERAGKPRTALAALGRLEAERWEGASDRARFRLLTNQGACQYHLGAWPEAAALFDRARAFGGGDVQAVANAALAAVLRGDAPGARALADEALALSPASVEAAALRVLAAFDEPDVDDPLSLVPADLASAAPVAAMAARWHRERGHAERCRELLERSHALDPDDHGTKVDLAVALLEPIAIEAARTGRRRPDSAGGDLARAERLLREAWGEVRETEGAANRIEAAIDLAVALEVDGRDDEAAATVVEASRIAPDDGRVIRHQAHQAAKHGRFGEALEALDRLPAAWAGDVECAVARFRALAGLGRHADALALQGELERSLDGPRRVAARADKVRLLWSLGRRGEARSEADRLVADAPGEARYLLASASVRRWSGDGEAARLILHDAVRAMPDDDAPGRAVAGEALFALSDWDGAADALETCATPDRDGDELRTLVAALVNADRRRQARTLLDALPAEIADDPFFRRAGARLGAAVGDLASARRDAERVLAVDPGDVETRMLWLDSVTRAGDASAAGAFLDGDLSPFDGVPVRSRIALAGMLEHHGRHGRAVSTAYDTLRANWGDRDAHKAYHGLLLLSPRAAASIPAMDAVGPDAGFVVASRAPGGSPASYLVEARPMPLDARLGEVAPASPVATRANGLRVGDRVRVNDHPAADDVEILEVGHKHLRLGRRSLAEFSGLFPDERGFFGFGMDRAAPEQAIGKIRDVALLRRGQAEEVAEAYATSDMPVAVAARLAGVEAPVAWFGMARLGQTLDVSEGSRAELGRATALLSRRGGLVLDPLTFWLAGAHGWLGVLRDAFGPLGVTRSGIDALRRMADGQVGDGGVIAADPAGGPLAFVSRTPEQARLARDAAEDVVAFALGDGAVVLDAMPRRDLDRAARELGRMVDPAHLDAVTAADGSGRLLLCEDRRMRAVAATCLPGGVRSVWLQPALMRAAGIGAMGRAAYVEATVALALAGHHFTMLDADALALAARRGAWSAEGDFARLADVVGAPTVDVRTALPVVTRFLRDLWSGGAPPAARDALTERLLGALVRGHPEEAGRVLDAARRGVHPRPPGDRLAALRAGSRLRRLLDRLAREAATDVGGASRRT